MTKSEKKLLSIYRQLHQQSQVSLIDFAEFLLAKGTCEPPEVTQSIEAPSAEAPPANESVVAAIKRLQRSYRMLDTNSLFNEASSLMSAHMVQGRPAEEVIIELEALFDKNYRAYFEQSKSHN